MPLDHVFGLVVGQLGSPTRRGWRSGIQKADCVLWRVPGHIWQAACLPGKSSRCRWRLPTRCRGLVGFPVVVLALTAPVVAACCYYCPLALCKLLLSGAQPSSS